MSQIFNFEFTLIFLFPQDITSVFGGLVGHVMDTVSSVMSNGHVMDTVTSALNPNARSFTPALNPNAKEFCPTQQSESSRAAQSEEGSLVSAIGSSTAGNR